MTMEECLAFLEEAREALDDLSVAEDRLRQQEQDEKRLSKELDAEKKTVAEVSAQTVKKRREEINAGYEAEIKKAQDELKKARSSREKAKNKGMEERIKEETAELHSHNSELRTNMKTIFRQNHVPFLCRNRLYYSLYFPRWLKEYLVLLLYVAVAFVAIPWGVWYLLAPERQTLYLVIIYLLDVVIFGSIYMAVGNHTKLHYMEPLKQGRQHLDEIHANNRKIRVITSTIRKDRNESFYDLEKYDDEIARISQELADVSAQKKDALNTFETVTKNILQDEIEMNHKEKIDGLQTELADVREQLKNTATEVKQKKLSVQDQYGTHLGKEFLDPLKIAELETIIREGRALNISEAIDVYGRKEG
ncbi:MAG: cell envelope integrity protein TolA [Clostridiales bacterium]|nr:cell envelope integrity protein TolA [Clostridiales bacterium]